MSKISLKIMYSDTMFTIEDGINEKITLEDEENVANKVKNHLEEHFGNEDLEEISILLLSYTNSPQLPSNLFCKKWSIKCESHTPYVLDLLKSIPLNSDYLNIEIDNGSFYDIADTEQVITAKHLSLSNPDLPLGVSEKQKLKFQATELFYNGQKV